MQHTDLIDNYGIVFDAKPDAVPYNYRISYKVSQICLILDKSCWGKSGCSPVKLHMISFALSSKEIMQRLIDFTQSEYASPPIVRFDPSVNRAVSFAIADELIIQAANGKYVLTDKGKLLVSEIEKDSEVLVVEKQDLSSLSKKLTEEKIKRLSEVWRATYAEN
ncbi:hypothetical protein [Pygmaiobacter massiliensis]|uniref:hypothetical protein n=1 Tax=Pygmaiobacter massiliensis TaxID=1917873 RepID=UPI002897F4AF|nr:hypothetical protein [Pygmaiobacter massiliensis]